MPRKRYNIGAAAQQMFNERLKQYKDFQGKKTHSESNKAVSDYLSYVKGYKVKGHKQSQCAIAKSTGTIRQGKRGGLYINKKSKITGLSYKRYCK